MDPLALIEHATEAGLDLSLVDGELRVRGPRRLASLVKLIGDNKQAVVATLSGVDSIQAELSRAHPPTVGVTETPANAENRIGFADTGVSRSVQHTGLIGRGFPPHASPVPPEAIRATKPELCPRCAQRPVLRELRTITGGLCWTCHSVEAQL
jgi:hypothetical protein